jgi:ABC-2 type transport system permease protein
MREAPLNIFLRELRANLKSLLIWSVIIVLLIVMAVAKFAAFAGDPASLALVDSLPPAMLDAFGLRAFNMTTLTGFYGVMFIYFSLMGAIAAAIWGSDIIAKEERDKTVEFSLVLPVSRNRVVTAKALAALTNCIAFVLITWAASLVAVRSYGPDQAFFDYLALQMQGLFAIELIFLAIGLLLGCALGRRRIVGGIATGLILGAYFISIIVSLQQDLGFLRWLSPFKYFDAAELFRSGRLDGAYLAVSAAIVVACLAGAYWTYNRRDLYI